MCGEDVEQWDNTLCGYSAHLWIIRISICHWYSEEAWKRWSSWWTCKTSELSGCTSELIGCLPVFVDLEWFRLLCYVLKIIWDPQTPVLQTEHVVFYCVEQGVSLINWAWVYCGSGSDGSNAEGIVIQWSNCEVIRFSALGITTPRNLRTDFIFVPWLSSVGFYALYILCIFNWILSMYNHCTSTVLWN